ncbi:hypothetical protein SRHO_G00059120 [Serrasalmus rhombeus]
MIATDNQPFTVVSDVGFRRLMAVVEPKYNLKSEKYYRTEMLDSVHTKVVKKIKALTAPDNAGPHLSFTTDCWSGETESLMSLTCHFIDRDRERKQIVLNVKAMFGSLTGDYICGLFLDMMGDWGIDLDRVVLVLRDSGANMIRGMRLAEIPDLSCSAHLLQLVHGIIQAVPTRWNSTLHMLQRMLEQKRALSVYSGEHGKFAGLSAEQWDIISNLVDTLGPIEEVTLEMSKAEACISCIIPSIAVLKMLLQAEGPTARGIKTFHETMLQSLEKRFSKIEETKCLVLATLLDP